MRYLYVLTISIIFPLICHAQKNWYVGMNIGGSAGSFSEPAGVIYPVPDFDPGILIDLEGGVDLNKHWQVGISFETGRTITAYTYVSEYYNRDGMLEHSYENLQRPYVRNYYYFPAATARYKLNFGALSYAYAGVLAGVHFEPQSNIPRKTFGYPTTGVDAGLALGINQHVKLTINPGWRMFYAELKERTWSYYSYKPEEGYYISYSENALKHYFNFSVGITAVF